MHEFLTGVLKELLINKGLIEESRWEQIVKEARLSNHKEEDVLLDLGILTEIELRELLVGLEKIEIVDLDKISIAQEVVKKIPASAANIYTIVPIDFKDNVLYVAMADPLNIKIHDELRFTLGYNVKALLAKRSQIEKLIQIYYSQDEHAIEEGLGSIKEEAAKFEEAEPVDVGSVKELAQKAPIINFLNQVLLDAIVRKASDIHLEPGEDDFKIRFRIDGVLYNILSLPRKLKTAVTSRVKIMANLDITQSRLPQDGRIVMQIAGRAIDLRVSTLPTIFGESIALRILDKQRVNLSLDDIGLEGADKEKIMQFIKKPYGIILVTGPTGAGKTTTLYSCLKLVNRLESKLITAEDPVEYDISGIVQVEIKSRIDLTFARTLRHILRQDPDIIMVGEIRDQETAQILIQASLTGHLVFSTLHTNDAPSAISRLIDMGIEPFLIASTLDVIIAQRLIRILCPECRRPHKPTEEEISLLKIDKDVIGKQNFFEPVGCNSCAGTGFKGRLGIYEILIMSDEVRALTMDKASLSNIRETARKSGMKTLKEDGLTKAAKGLTSLDEIIQQTKTYI